MLVVEKITKKFNDFIVFKDISFSLQKGECLGIVGKNGAGKSTLIECLLDEKKLTSGKIDFNEVYRVGVQFQEANFDRQLKVKEVCNLFSSLYGVSDSIAKTYLKFFNLHQKRNQYTSKLSGGEKQKLNILCALIHNPELIVFDELTTGLDTQTRKEMYKILQDLKAKGKTIILITHYYEELDNLADKVLYLSDAEGKIIKSDNKNEISLLVNEVTTNV